MWNEPSEKELARMPPLYTNENTKLEDIMIHMHFFFGGSDWYMAEYSQEDRIFFGYTILNGDYQNSEWGYTLYDELRNIRIPPGFEIDRDLHWEPTKVSDIEKIMKGMK